MSAPDQYAEYLRQKTLQAQREVAKNMEKAPAVAETRQSRPNRSVRGHRDNRSPHPPGSTARTPEVVQLSTQARVPVPGQR